HAIAAVRVLAWKVVDLELVVATDAEGVRHLANRDLGEDSARGMQLLEHARPIARQLEAVVPEDVLARAELLHLLPSENAVGRPLAALPGVVGHFRLPG